tara:strand:- start:33085 stop:34215 length:1131 start_codon:yes stop_codon:yes gene_type:complete
VNTEHTEIAIIGGGLQGLSTALHLAQRGRRVMIIEAHHPGRFASGVNAGGVRRLGRDPAEIPLAMAASEMWHSIEDLVDDDCGFRAVGQLKIAEDDADLRKLEARAAMVRDLGFDHEEIIDQKRLRVLAPGVHARAVGGLWCEDDGSADPMRTVQAFYRKARALGVAFKLGQEVSQIAKVGTGWQMTSGETQITSDIVINCAGAWGNKIAAMIGEEVPLETHALTMMVSERTPHFIDPVCGLASRKLSFKQTLEGTLLIGGAHLGYADRDAGIAEPDPVKMAISAKTVSDVFPHLANVRIARAWAGLEGMTPDRLPIISPSKVDGSFFHAFGFSAHGFQLSPVVGRIMSSLICDDTSNLPLYPFRIERFSDGETKL